MLRVLACGVVAASVFASAGQAQSTCYTSYQKSQFYDDAAYEQELIVSDAIEDAFFDHPVATTIILGAGAAAAEAYRVAQEGGGAELIGPGFFAVAGLAMCDSDDVTRRACTNVLLRFGAAAARTAYIDDLVADVRAAPVCR